MGENRQNREMSAVARQTRRWACFGVVVLAAVIVSAGRADPPAASQPNRPASKAATSQPASSPSAPPWTVANLREDAQAVRPLFKSPLVQDFCAAADLLPSIAPRIVVYDVNHKTAQLLPEGAKAESQPTSKRTLELGEQYYYTTRYGTPLAYSRPLQILAEAGMTDVAGKRVLDFGYGTIGHLRMLASMGADVVGVEVDPILQALYSRPSDTGEIVGRGGRKGRLSLVHGSWPGDASVAKQAGGGFDLILSKNTLKRGYIHPERKVDARMTINLGVADEAFVKAVYDALKPGGRFLIYNLCPAPSPPDKPYIPWADGRCPFDRSLMEKAGFTFVAFDQDDSIVARDMGRALGWDQGEGAMDLKADLFGHYTLAIRPK